uniref:Uncharacterized protein n=1 Tax=Nelumbo nucifera TaxID=4432 RepID=A0A822Y8R2_NELNU|nr:TPA_asm: hypothetical protein HUJ06_027456 [Nelumbo nucifera]
MASIAHLIIFLEPLLSSWRERKVSRTYLSSLEAELSFPKTRPTTPCTRLQT